MHQRRYGCFLYAFEWCGREYRVEAVERCWTVYQCGREGGVEEYCFRVRAQASTLSSSEVCQEGTYHLFQDTQTSN